MVADRVTHILWSAAGSPPQVADASGACRICGTPEVDGTSFDSWVRDTFTDWDKIVPGDLICQPCQFCFSEASEMLARTVGRDKPQRMRNYSHFIVDGEWCPLSKTHKLRMVELLRRKFDVAIVADSGQKHIIFRAVPGIAQFEEQSVFDLDGALGLLEPIEILYASFSKKEIGSGAYRQHRVIHFGVNQWIELERTVKPARGSLSFDLALFLAQRTENERTT